MGIGKLFEEIGGAVAAEQAAEAADPNAGILIKGAAAAAGFFGAAKLDDAVEGHIQSNKDVAQDTAQDAADASQPVATDANDDNAPEPK